MVAQMDRTKFHKVFAVEMQGSIVIVQPMGDAVSFRDSDVCGELNTVLQILDQLGPVNLLIDLGTDEYYGSTIIGAINQMGMKVRDAGGRVALCEASEQMLDVMRIMKLDELWVNFDSKRIALKALGKVS
jgi:anti-anti-sigma regulatory factor